MLPATADRDGFEQGSSGKIGREKASTQESQDDRRLVSRCGANTNVQFQACDPIQRAARAGNSQCRLLDAALVHPWYTVHYRAETGIADGETAATHAVRKFHAMFCAS